MANLQKEKIRTKLQSYCERFESQNKAANSLKNVSAGTISQLLNNKWELITDEMWLNIASQIGYTDKQWNTVETRNYKFMRALLNDASINNSVFGVISAEGSGKSVSINDYTENTKRVYTLKCNEYWNRKQFLTELLTAMGRDLRGSTVYEMMNEVIRVLKTQDNPVIIMDEADKLTDHVLYFFITLYNALEDHCGIVLCATSYLQKRIERGFALNKKGYREIYSRLGKKFIELPGVSGTDVSQICQANGITTHEQIKEVITKSEFDLRRVRRMIHALKNA